jgi:hypothetical protein
MKSTKFQQLGINFVFFVFCLAIFLLAFLQANFFLFAAFLLGLVSLMAIRLDLGWYGLVFLAPLLNWQIRLGDYPGIFGFYPPLLEVFASAAEFWAVLLLLAFIFRKVYDWFTGVSITLRLPGFGWYLLFLLSALVSLVHLNSLEFGVGVKYIFRFLVFLYFGYIFLGANIVTNKKILRRSLVVFAIPGVLAAIMGTVSLLLGVWQSGILRRAVPFALGGWAPFGDQHIFLAEVITVCIPVFIYFWHTAKRYKRIMGWLTLFLVSIALLTLSRAAWITMTLGFVAFVYFLRQEISLKKLADSFRWFIWLLIPFCLYLMYFLFTSVDVERSTNARVQLTTIAWYQFLERPVFGQGVGSFVGRLQEVEVFALEFGEALDAHGIIQKLIAEQGIVGLITFFIFLGWIFNQIITRANNRHYTSRAHLQTVLAMFFVLVPVVFQLFNTQYYSSRMWVPVALALGIVLVHSQEAKDGVLGVNFYSKKISFQTDI